MKRQFHIATASMLELSFDLKGYGGKVLRLLPFNLF